MSASPRYLSGVIWSGLNAAASVLLPFGIFIFFAHSLLPAEVGLVALAVSCSELLKAMGLSGLYEALLQQHDEPERHHQAASALLLLAGATLLLVYLLALLAASHFMPGIGAHLGLLALIGLRIPLDLATVQPQVVLAQRLSFRRLAMRSIVGNAVAGCLGVVVAVSMTPIAGLVLYQVGQSATVFAATSLGGGLIARPRLHRDCVRRMGREASMSTGVRLVAASINYLDQVVLGPLVGSTELAFYNLGKRLETTFVTAAGSFSSILFQPLFARQDAGGREAAVRRAMLVLTVICGLPAAIVAVNARTVIPLVFGHQWLDAAPVAGLLAVNGFVRAVGFVPGALLSVSGRNRELLLTSVVSAVAGLVLVACLAPFSLPLCAAAIALKNAANVGWMAWLTRDQAPRPLRSYAADVVIPFAVMVAVAALGRWTGGSGVAPGSPVAALLLVLRSAVPAGVWCLAFLGFCFAAPLRLAVAGLFSRVRVRA